jgi:hypothetical protein
VGHVECPRFGKFLKVILEKPEKESEFVSQGHGLEGNNEMGHKGIIYDGVDWLGIYPRFVKPHENSVGRFKCQSRQRGHF